MTKQLKKIKKNIKKFVKCLDPKGGLVVNAKFDTNVSVSKKGHESTPMMSIGSKGDYSISVLKLTLIFIGAISFMSGLVLLIGKVRETLRMMKLRREMLEYDKYNYEDYSEENV